MSVGFLEGSEALMSTNSPSIWPGPSLTSPDRLVRAIAGAARYVRPLLQATAFWSAVAMPFCYVPLLLGGLTGGEAPAFVALLAANGLALVLGHGHRQHEVEAGASRDGSGTGADTDAAR